jgi:hypothetical protein
MLVHEDRRARDELEVDVLSRGLHRTIEVDHDVVAAGSCIER